MVKTLRESKASLSELVELASQGEDVLISVRGTIKARLTRAEAKPASTGAAWARRLRALQRSYGTGSCRLPTEAILDDSRKDRL